MFVAFPSSFCVHLTRGLMNRFSSCVLVSILSLFFLTSPVFPLYCVLGQVVIFWVISRLALITVSCDLL